MCPRHLCILHVITPMFLVVVCQTERQCAANGKKTLRMAESAALLVDDVLPNLSSAYYLNCFSVQIKAH
jgi:hypothetical protein